MSTRDRRSRVCPVIAAVWRSPCSISNRRRTPSGARGLAERARSPTRSCHARPGAGVPGDNARASPHPHSMVLRRPHVLPDDKSIQSGRGRSRLTRTKFNTSKEKRRATTFQTRRPGPGLRKAAFARALARWHPAASPVGRGTASLTALSAPACGRDNAGHYPLDQGRRLGGSATSRRACRS